MSFGRYLKAIRKNRAISVEKLAKEICVTPRQLVFIESEDFDRMPPDVYTKGILRAYAEAVGVDAEDIIGRYNFDREFREEALRLEGERMGLPRKNLLRMVLALGVMGVVMAASLYGSGFLEGSLGYAEAPHAVEQPGQEAERPGSSQKEIVKTEAGNSDSPGLSIDSDPGMQVLSIDAVSETKVGLSVDDREYTKYELAPKDHLEVAAQSRFRVSINDPADIKVSLNGEPVEIAAEPGRPVNIVLPEKTESR